MEDTPGKGETNRDVIPPWETDFILVQEKVDESDPKSLDREKKRQKFLNLLKKDFKIEWFTIENRVYIKLLYYFQRLCQEAERVKLEMPLKNGRGHPKGDIHAHGPTNLNENKNADQLDASGSTVLDQHGRSDMRTTKGDTSDDTNQLIASGLSTCNNTDKNTDKKPRGDDESRSENDDSKLPSKVKRKVLKASGLIGLGDQYKDSGQGTCMSQLSFQVMMLMIVKPLPKFFMDIILPFFRSLWRRLPCRNNKISPETHYLERERLKFKAEDFTIGEYTEKIIQYGFLMLFAASFPLAPLLAFITNIIDLRVDAKRLLTFYRRPIAFKAQDIGIWYSILTFVNFCGVISNAFLLAFTSTWGQQFDLSWKLGIVILFEEKYPTSVLFV